MIKERVEFPECKNCDCYDYELICCAASQLGLAVHNLWREIPVIKSLFENTPPKKCAWFMEGKSYDYN